MYRAIPFDTSTSVPVRHSDHAWHAQALRASLDSSERLALRRSRELADQLASALLEHARALVRVRLADGSPVELREAIDEKRRFGRLVADLELKFNSSI
jgi:hypothetical protein